MHNNNEPQGSNVNTKTDPLQLNDSKNEKPDDLDFDGDFSDDSIKSTIIEKDARPKAVNRPKLTKRNSELIKQQNFDIPSELRDQNSQNETYQQRTDVMEKPDEVKRTNRQLSDHLDELDFDFSDSLSEDDEIVINEADRKLREEADRLNQSVRDILGPEHPHVTSPRQLPPLSTDHRPKSGCSLSSSHEDQLSPRSKTVLRPIKSFDFTASDGDNTKLKLNAEFGSKSEDLSQIDIAENQEIVAQPREGNASGSPHAAPCNLTKIEDGDKKDGE